MIIITASLRTLLLLAFRPYKTATLCGTSFVLSLATIPLLTAKSAATYLAFTDSLAAPLILLTIWLLPLIILARPKFATKNYSLFLTTLVTLTIFLLIAFASPWLFIFYTFFEASLLPTIALIILWGYQPERLQARTYLILYTVGASLPLLISIIIIQQTNHHTSFMLPI